MRWRRRIRSLRTSGSDPFFNAEKSNSFRVLVNSFGAKGSAALSGEADWSGRNGFRVLDTLNVTLMGRWSDSIALRFMCDKGRKFLRKAWVAKV